MVIYKELSAQKLKVAREWRDHQEQLITLLTLAIGFFLGLLISYFAIKQALSFLIFLELCIGVLLLYYFLPGNDVIIDLPLNRWDITYKFFGIPYFRVSRRILDTSQIVVVETHQDITKVGRIFWGRKVMYMSSLQIWGFEQAQERDKIVLFQRTLYSSTAYQAEFKKYCEIGKKIELFFHRFGVPIEFDIIRDLKYDIIRPNSDNVTE